MGTHCVSCKKNTRNKISGVRRTKQNRLMFVSSFPIFGKNKSSFIKNQEASGLVSK